MSGKDHSLGSWVREQHGQINAGAKQRGLLGERRALGLAGANITTEGDKLSTEIGPRSQRASFIMMNEPILYSISDGESEKCFTQGDPIRLHSTLRICQVLSLKHTQTHTSLENIRKGV